VAAHEQADTDLLNDLFLANDYAAHLLDNLGIYFSETTDPGLECLRVNLGGHDEC